jgi:hypothetical protein
MHRAIDIHPPNGRPQSTRIADGSLSAAAHRRRAHSRICATLPNAAREIAIPHARRVEFEGAQGPVSAARSKAILFRLADADGASDVLQRHLAYEQALNAESPLMLGNKLTLLQNGPATYHAMFAAIRGDACQDGVY